MGWWHTYMLAHLPRMGGTYVRTKYKVQTKTKEEEELPALVTLHLAVHCELEAPVVTYTRRATFLLGGVSESLITARTLQSVYRFSHGRRRKQEETPSL